MREDWAEKLKQKLAGHRKTPPAGLWEGISLQMSEMGFTAEPVRQKSVSRRLYWAAAAAVLALVGFFVFHSVDDKQPLQAELSSPQPISPTQDAQNALEHEPLTVAPEPVLALAQTVSPHRATKLKEPVTPQVSAKPEVSVKSEAQETFKQEEAVKQEEPVKSEEPVKQEDTKTIRSKTMSQHVGVTKQEFAEVKTVETSRSWSVGLNASGGLLVAQTSQRVDRLYYDKADYSSNKEIDAVSITPMSYSLTEYVSEHHLPLRFGLSLNYQLSPRVALLTGINYTYLYSEFSIPLYPNASYNQKLHYLGIPLSLSYQLWTADHFRLYLSGGVMLEKCVSAHVDGITISDKPWQWSLEASAGAEYTIIPQLGFYLEPSLGYYFKDGTSLEHYYKEHPLTPSIEFGLRLHLKE